MREKQSLVYLNAVIQAQKHLVQTAEIRLDSVGSTLSKTSDMPEHISELSGIMDELEANIDSLPSNALDDWDDDLVKIDAIYHSRQQAVQLAKSRLDFRSWDQFVRDSVVYCMANDLDPMLPYSSFLTEEDLATLKREDYAAQYRWDKWDYVIVGTAGFLAALTDFLLVRVPTRLSSSGEVRKTITYRGKEYAGSPLTAFLQKHINSTEGNTSWFADWARQLEKTCKVPYDEVKGSGIQGISGRTHRMQTLGHDPILGFIFGVLDIMRGTVSGFSYDKLTGTHRFVVNNVGAPASTNLIEAFLKQLGHLISDIGTSNGLPPPFFALLQSINVRIPTSPKGRTVGEIARWMYLNGYDLRHFIASGITPSVIELVVRAYLMTKIYFDEGEVKVVLANNPKYRSMLLSAHAIAAAANAGKVAVMQGNPLAVNYAEWLALLRYLIPSLKYWLFDKRRLRLEHMMRINEQGWDQLMVKEQILLECVCHDEMPIIALGD